MYNGLMNDTSMFDIIDDEFKRQSDGLELIPSENYVSRDILRALGSELTNKYAEGYPGRRYYGGQENTDKVESLAIERAKTIFGADHANVQPHSGAQANEAVYHSWLEPGDTVLAMDLSHGGHLTHGHPVTVLSRQYNFVRYRMSNIAHGTFDFDEIRKLALLYRPKILLVGYSSYPRELDYSSFARIGNEVGALLVADIAHIAGLIAGGVLANPFDSGFHVLSSTTHKTLRGPRGGLILTKGHVSNPLRQPEKSILNIPTLIDRTVFPGMQGGPLMNVIAAKGISFHEALQPNFKVYARTVVENSKALASELLEKGFQLVTRGTDNHMLLIDTIASLGIDGAEAEKLLDAVGLNVNKNVIPDDLLPPFRPSGIRLGTPAVTTRGLRPKDMPLLAGWIDKTLRSKGKVSTLDNIRGQVREFVQAYPLPSIGL
jgi:glycine hydroxymethyltransferase